MIRKLQVSLTVLFYITFTSAAFSEPNISILWERDVIRADTNFITPYTIKVDENKNIVRVVGISCIYRRQETPKKQNPELFEYRFNLKNNTCELKPLIKMNEDDITIFHPSIQDSRLIDHNIVMIRSQYKSFNFQELNIGNDWQVKTREIPGLTRKSVSTFGACRNMNGDVFLCGNSGYIRKVKSDGIVTWDTNYKSDKTGNNTLGVVFSESENMLVAFGCSYEPNTKFTTKNSSLWLANLDSDGNFIAKTKFEGITNFGKFPSFCLSESGNSMVIYDNAEMGSYKIYVSKFSKDLSSKAWTTPIFDGNDMIISRMSLTPLENNYTLATLSTFPIGGNSNSLIFYIIDNNGNMVNKAVFNNIRVSPGFVTTVFKDRIFLATEGRIFEKAEDNTAKLICFKISPFPL
ncbi:MAG: hypothetical protein WC476_06365 [Phycisphaerae bacterium]|jgi:hypothetical protein